MSYRAITHIVQFRSPQLLMVSGVGPSAILRQLGIPTVYESESVGQGMWVRENQLLVQQLGCLRC